MTCKMRIGRDYSLTNNNSTGVCLQFLPVLILMSMISFCWGCDRLGYRCQVGESCIDVAQRCNGVKDCRLGDDENGCKTCAPTAFRCPSDREITPCIPKANVCNGFKDCLNGEDEIRCYRCLRRCNFETVLKHFKKINLSQHCDGITDCPCGDDEAKCDESSSNPWRWLGPAVGGAFIGMCCLSSIINIWRTYKSKSLRLNPSRITRQDLEHFCNRPQTRTRSRSIQQEISTAAPVMDTPPTDDGPPPYTEVAFYNVLTSTAGENNASDGVVVITTDTSTIQAPPPPYSSLPDPTPDGDAVTLTRCEADEAPPCEKSETCHGDNEVG